jgi:hypothetical protein
VSYQPPAYIVLLKCVFPGFSALITDYVI